MTQELREVAKKYKDLWLPDDHYDAFIAGATWQAERMYSEAQVREAIVKSAISDIDSVVDRCDTIIQSLKTNKL